MRVWNLEGREERTLPRGAIDHHHPAPRDRLARRLALSRFTPIRAACSAPALRSGLRVTVLGPHFRFRFRL